MPISFTVKQKGIFASKKKTLPLEVILGDTLIYGSYPKDDKDRLKLHTLGTREFVAVAPHAFGRGIWVFWKKDETKKIRLLLPTPCHNEEITELFNILTRISGYWDCNIICDDRNRRVHPKNLEKERMAARKYNRKALHELIDLTGRAKGGITLQCAGWPLCVSAEAASRFLQTPTTFDDWLHTRLSIDAYYSRPDYYRLEDGTVEGEYDILNDRYLILPYEPFDAPGETFTKDGKQVGADRYTMYLFTEKAGDIIGVLPYDIFINVLDQKKIHDYDGRCFLLDPLSSEDIEKIYADGTEMIKEIEEEGEGE